LAGRREAARVGSERMEDGIGVCTKRFGGLPGLLLLLVGLAGDGSAAVRASEVEASPASMAAAGGWERLTRV
jgi:hypothetical protein